MRIDRVHSRGARALFRGLALAVMTVLVPASAPSAGAAIAQGSQGLQAGWAIDDSGNVSFTHSYLNQLDTIQQAGAGWVRINFRLGGCFTNWTSVGCNGMTALQTYDQVISSARSHNLQILGLLSNESWPGTQSDWQAQNAETAGGTGDNAYVQAFAHNAAGVLAQHYAGSIASWEVWNEPNAWTSTDGQGHYSGGTYLYPSNFAWLLKRSYSSIKSAQPSSTVVSGGLFAHQSMGVAMVVVQNGVARQVVKRGDVVEPNPARNGGGSGSPSQGCTTSVPSGADSGADYLCATYKMGTSKAQWKKSSYPLDQVGQHLYLDQGGTTSSSTVALYLQDLHNAYVSYEGASTPKKLHVTEVGWTTAAVSPAVQAQNLQTAYSTFHSTSYVGRAYWFNNQDVPEAGLFYGLVDTNGLPKPSQSAYQSSATY